MDLSRPMRLALEAGVARSGDDIFDYGCGHGTDIAFLRAMGHNANGWDPNHAPEHELRPAAVVNLGYVLNVIEDQSERADALRQGWRLASRALIVSVRTANELRSISHTTDHYDGVLTGKDTFQKLYGQAEARAYVDQVLDVRSIPLGVGVFVAFKEDAAEQEWLENRAAVRRRVRRLHRIAETRKSMRDQAYEQHRHALRPLEEFIAERGRLPTLNEQPWTAAIVDALGSIPKAFQVIRHVADQAWWEAAAADRREELLVRFALSRLRRRPKFSALPYRVQRDIKSLFGSYKALCKQADDLLFSIGDTTMITTTAAATCLGKRTPDALYIHVDAIDLLPPPLRVFIGAAEALIGGVPDATLVKAHLHRPRVSYLVYPKFNDDPHPVLAESWVVDFHGLNVRPTDYTGRSNPPILHRKELFVAADHPRRKTFARLTEQEERHGLLDEVVSIGTRDGWQARLDAAGWRLRGHRLVHA